MKAFLVGLPILSILTSYGIAADAQSIVNQFKTADICIKGDSIDQDCAKSFEKSQASRYRRYYRQTKEGLTLLDEHGKTLADFQNTKAETDMNFYAFEDLNLTIGYFLINHGYYEGAQYMLVSLASGKQFELSAIPVVSPNREKMVAADCEPEAEMLFGGTNKVQVFKITPQELIEERVTGVGVGCFSKAQWLDDNTIALEGPTEGASKISGSLKFQNGKWELFPPQLPFLHR